jgi:hypothetical protein
LFSVDTLRNQKKIISLKKEKNITFLHQMAQNQTLRGEFHQHHHYSNIFFPSNPTLYTSFIMRLRKLEKIISILNNYVSPDLISQSDQVRIHQLKGEIETFDFYWAFFRNIISKDEKGIYLDGNN